MTRGLLDLLTPAGAQQQVVSGGKSCTRQVLTNLLLLLLLLLLHPPPAATKVCCFESHSQAPEGLLIPISDNSPQSLIIYSCPPVNNKTKQNKTKENDRNGWKGGAGKSKPLRFRPPLPAPAFDLLMMIAIKIITVYTAGRQKFSISRLICFSPALLSFSTKKRGRKPLLFSLNFWLLLKPKLLSCKGGGVVKVRSKTALPQLLLCCVM